MIGTAPANDPRHRAIQAAGRDKWYEYYRMEVADIVRVSAFQKP